MSEKQDGSFMNALGGIKPLKQDKIDPRADVPRAAAKVRSARPSTTTEPLKIRRQASPEPTEAWFHHGLQKKRIRALRSGRIAVDLRCDLHGFTAEQARRELDLVLRDALQHQLRLLLIIHGKGFNSEKGPVIKPLVLRWLLDQASVLAWCPALPQDGGSGATYVYLSQNRR